MKITRLKPSVRRPGFVTVFVDEARLAVLPGEEIRALGLTQGMALDGQEREALETAAERAKAYDAAIRLLSIRGRAVQEVMTRLRRKGLRPDAVDHAVGRLESEGFLDDAVFAQEFARVRVERGFGRTRILAELSRKGVDRREAENAVSAAGEDDEGLRRERILALARKRAGQLHGLDRAVARRRLVGYLARRGHGGADAWDVVAEVIDELGGRGHSGAVGDA